MFNRNKNETPSMKSSNTKVSSNTHSLVSLVQGTYVEGTVDAESDIRIDGIIKGKLNCQAKVIVGPSGHIDGEIRCENAVIEGSVKGLLRVNDLLNVRETAKVEGKVHTEKLIVQSGALFNVNCQMGGTTGSAEQSGPSAKSEAKPEGALEESTAETQHVGDSKRSTT